MKYQRYVKNQPNRKMLHPWLSKSVRDAIRKDARKFGVSESFVMETAICLSLGIKPKEKYYDLDR